LDYLGLDLDSAFDRVTDRTFVSRPAIA
jgi:hypothetical protein